MSLKASVEWSNSPNIVKNINMNIQKRILYPIGIHHLNILGLLTIPEAASLGNLINRWMMA